MAMFTADTVLPTDWLERSLVYCTSEPDRHWVEMVQKLLSRIGEQSLAVWEVRRLVLGVLGFSGSTALRSPDWLAGVPQPEFSVAQAWTDHPTSPGDVWHASHVFRAVDSELDVLRVLANQGWDVVRRAKFELPLDWRVVKGGNALDVEVKSKGGDGDFLDLLYGLVVARQMFSSPGPGRALSWEVGTAANAAAASSLPDRAKCLALQALWDAYDEVEQIVSSDESSGGDVSVRNQPEGVTTSASWYPPDLSVHIGVGQHDAIVCNAEFEQDAPAVLIANRARADWEVAKLDEDMEATTLGFLDSCLLKRGPKRGRQVVNSPANSLFVVVWNAPYFWDNALADHPDTMERLVAGLSKEVDRYKPGAAIGVWPRAFKRTAGRVWLNGSAQALLGAEQLLDPARHRPTE